MSFFEFIDTVCCRNIYDEDEKFKFYEKKSTRIKQYMEICCKYVDREEEEEYLTSEVIISEYSESDNDFIVEWNNF